MKELVGIGMNRFARICKSRERAFGLPPVHPFIC
jgi:hypothetical protein